MIGSVRDWVIGAWVVTASSFAAQALAQAPAPGTPPEIEPIRCWWRTSAGAVATGEPFSVTVTCAVLENGPMQVVPDEAALTVSAVQLAPFEVLGGSHPADLRTEQRRFFQYHYTLRLIDPDAIGKDVKLPDLPIHYRVHRVGEAEASAEGRDQLYVLPGPPLRVTSLVPADAPDIRDGADEGFGLVESLQFRSRLLQISAVALGVFGLIVLMPAVARLFGHRQERKAAGPAMMPARTLLRHAAGELAAVQSESRHGWTEELAVRAASALRIAAACALGRRTSQHVLARRAQAPAGRLFVRRGWLRSRAVSVSSPVSSLDVAQAIARLAPETPIARRDVLESLHGALDVLTAALYGSRAELDGASLDAALESGLSSVTRLTRAQAWPLQYFSGRFGRVADPGSVA